jgi:hypothetical protein
MYELNSGSVAAIVILSRIVLAESRSPVKLGLEKGVRKIGFSAGFSFFAVQFYC